ncbi:hypothetical protein SLE2022_057140 [Rubroshorea leprosula]
MHGWQAQVKVLAIYRDEDKAIRAGPSENLQVKLSGIEEENVLSGFVLCSVGEQLDLCLRDSQILHNLEGLLFELKLQWEKSWTFLQVPVHKKVLLLEVCPPDSPYERVLKLQHRIILNEVAALTIYWCLKER